MTPPVAHKLGNDNLLQVGGEAKINVAKYLQGGGMPPTSPTPKAGKKAQFGQKPKLNKKNTRKLRESTSYVCTYD